MNNKILSFDYENKVRKGCKDCFHSFMVKDAEFDGQYDIPYIPKQLVSFNVKRLISYADLGAHVFKDGDVIHFYIDDYKFDGLKGIWNFFINEKTFKRGFQLSKISAATAIITPDFSLYGDMPRAMQIWNTYRSRAVGYYLNMLGFNVISNVRWTDEKSYEYAFSGLHLGQIVAVGTLGCSKCKNDKIMFINGFYQMIKRVKPKTVIIYGSVFAELKELIRKYNIDYIQFPTSISSYYKEKSNGSKI